MKKTIVKAAIMGIVLLVCALWGCPVFNLFHIPCPGCGLTRAWISFFRGDLPSALRYHFFFLPTPIFILAFLRTNKKEISRLSRLSLISFSVILFLYNLLRIFGIVPSFV